MKIEIKTVKENEDGSADVEVWLDDDAREFLIRKALIDTLTEAAVEQVKEFNTPKDEE